MGKIIDKTGQKYGRLTVLYLAPYRKSGRITWHCRCDCGNEIDVISSHLTSGHTRSCGCLQKEAASKLNPALDLTGQHFGKLTAIERAPSKNSHTYWKCICDCGNTIITATTSLTSGHTTSCGCINSKGEERISKWLQENNINFETQKIFDTCRNPKTNVPLRFDFYIDQKILLEYDGITHYQPTQGWNDQTLVKDTKYRDSLKDEWAKQNNIPLVRISYNDCYNNDKIEVTLKKVIEEYHIGGYYGK